MDVFEEHQLFIPIINDGRFATGLHILCKNNKLGNFKRRAFDALMVIRRENNLSVSSKNAETVRNALWEYYMQMTAEECSTFNPSCLPRTTAPKPFEHNPCCEIPTPPKEEPIVAKTPAFETKHFVNSVEASTLSDNDLISAIKDLETEIKALNDVKTASTRIKIKIEQLDQQRLAIAALLDARP